MVSVSQVRARLTSWWQELSAAPPAERNARLLVLLAVLVGIGLRFTNYWLHPPSLWQDEAYWAVKTLTTEAIDAQIRPLGFMLLTQGALRLFGAAAQVFRILPFLGSLLSMLLAPYVVARLFRSPWLRVAAAALLATNPVALEMAAEFKHYGTEVGVFMLLLAVTLRHFERRTTNSLLLLLVTAWLSFFLSITVIFAYPVIFGFLGWDALRSRQFRRLAMVAATTVACLATITTIYFTTWRGISANKAEQKWGTWYDVFYLKNGLKTQYDSRAAWTTAKYFELASVPGVGRELWRSKRVGEAALTRLKQVDRVAWGVLHVAGLLLLARRRRFLELGLLWSPLLFVTAFNLAGRWPAGAFRTNTFYVPYAIFIACQAGEWLVEWPVAALRRYVIPAFAVLLLLPTLAFHPGLFEKGLFGKPGQFTEALLLLPQNPPKRPQRLLMDFASCRPWEYYAFYDRSLLRARPNIRRDYVKDCRRRHKDIMSEFKRLVRTQPRGFAALMTDDRKFDAVERAARESCKNVEIQWVAGRTHLLVVCRPRG